jgi:UDP-N-acetylmuramoyl-tripeptide--D-alanyl-D-alanine ligase
MKNIFKKIITYILQIESRLVLAKYKPKIVAITGSVGKTSTKDAVYAVLSTVAYVRTSEKSYNSEMGIPLTILGISNAWSNPFLWFVNILKGVWLIVTPHKYPEWLVLEVGVGKMGDMQKTASWLKSDAVIITAIGDTPAHIEFFNSRKNLIDEKAGLINTLNKNGFFILNADDPDVLEMKNRTKNITITYGFKDGADVVGSGDTIFYNDKKIPKGIIFRIDEEGRSLPVFIEGVFGRNHIYASLAALTFASIFKMNMLKATDSLKNYDISPGRMRVLDGINNSLIIDDTYNSSPFACESALKTLSEIESTSIHDMGKNMNRKIAVLGDMLELGRHTEEAHKNIGKISTQFVDYLIVVGPRAKYIKEGAIENKMKEKNIFEFENSIQAGEFMQTFVKDGDLILVKGSQGMRMERVVEAILLNKENKETLLVRQDKEWLAKK